VKIASKVWRTKYGKNKNAFLLKKKKETNELIVKIGKRERELGGVTGCRDQKWPGGGLYIKKARQLTCS